MIGCVWCLRIAMRMHAAPVRSQRLPMDAINFEEVEHCDCARFSHASYPKVQRGPGSSFRGPAARLQKSCDSPEYGVPCLIFQAAACIDSPERGSDESLFDESLRGCAGIPRGQKQGLSEFTIGLQGSRPFLAGNFVKTTDEKLDLLRLASRFIFKERSHSWYSKSSHAAATLGC